MPPTDTVLFPAAAPAGISPGISGPGRNRVAKPRGCFLCDKPATFADVWETSRRERLREWLEVSEEVIGSAGLESRASELAEVEVLISTWGMPALTERQLDLFPRLKVLFYAAGTVKPFAGPLLERGITVVSAAAANAIPAAEFALSQILFALKNGWSHVRYLQANPGKEGWRHRNVTGAYGSTVGVISLGMVGRKLCELLRPFHLRKIAYDPVAPPRLFAEQGLERVSLGALFSESDVVTLHAPWLKETEGLITGELLLSMKPNATFINTARGAIVRENELVEALRLRPDLTAVLDVVRPEPPRPGSALYELPNILLTPHLAGSAGNELHRMADAMLEDLGRWLEGKPLRHAVPGKTSTNDN